MAEYKYRPLAEDEIRLLTLLPGEFRDGLRFSIFHERLTPCLPVSDDSRLTKSELRKTLPDDWTVHETPEGRYFFWSKSGRYLQYEHPNPKLSRKPRAS